MRETNVRVISGTCKGRPLKSISGQGTRPTTDKVKEAIFNMIGPYFQGGQGLDLYAGSGGLGIEALSRGIENVIFVDQNPKAIEMIKTNLKSCQYDQHAEVYRNDSRRALKAIVKRELKFHVIFLDPPYQKQRLSEELTFIFEQNLLHKDGVIVCEYDASFQLNDRIGQLVCSKQEQYGETVISIYELSDERG